MAAKKLTPQQQRDRRAKLMLGVFGVILLLVVAFQAPKLLHGSGGNTPGVVAVTTTATPVSALASAPTQLQRFTRFAAKDPFKARVSAPTATSPTATTPAPTPTTPRRPQKPLTINVTEKPALAAPTVPAALLTVNGKKTVVALGATFPKRSPMFRIVALSQKSIWVELVAGSFPNGQQTLKIDRGTKVTLDNVTAAVKFVLSLVKPTTAPAPTKTSP